MQISLTYKKLEFEELKSNPDSADLQSVPVIPDSADLQSVPVIPRWRGFAIRAGNTLIVIKKFYLS
jgi:hypothetical protein